MSTAATHSAQRAVSAAVWVEGFIFARTLMYLQSILLTAVTCAPVEKTFESRAIQPIDSKRLNIPRKYLILFVHDNMSANATARCP